MTRCPPDTGAVLAREVCDSILAVRPRDLAACAGFGRGACATRRCPTDQLLCRGCRLYGAHSAVAEFAAYLGLERPGSRARPRKPASGAGRRPGGPKNQSAVGSSSRQ